MKEEDRDYLRFLWVDDAFKERPEIQVIRFTRVVFGVSCSPFLLNATIRHHLEGCSLSQPELVSKILSSIYIEGPSQKSRLTKCMGVKLLLKNAGFNLRKFTSNSRQLRELIDREEVASQSTPNSQFAATKEEDHEQNLTQAFLGNHQELLPGEQGVLGVKWDIDTDQIIKVSEGVRTHKTKHSQLIVGQFYDPLGFLSPVVVKFKVFLQTLCEAKVSWDGTLSDSLRKEWTA